MKIAFDYDDTLDLDYTLFSIITNALILAKHEVYIITHIIPEYKEFREKQLKEYDIAYTELIISGDKMYECQKRGIEYIFDDVADYFKDINPIYLQVFPIPAPIKKILKDGTKVELKVKSNLKFSGGLSTEYNFRFKLAKAKKWSNWEYLDKKKSEIIKELNEMESLLDLENFWECK